MKYLGVCFVWIWICSTAQAGQLPPACSKSFVAAWDQMDKHDWMPVPKEPCLMKGNRGGVYLCNNDGCGRNEDIDLQLEKMQKN